MTQPTVLRADQAAVQHFPWGSLHWFANAQLGNSTALTLGECRLNPGCHNPPHQHPNCEEILHVVSGKILHHLQNHPPVELNPGDTITIPPHTLHHAENIGPDQAVMTIAFSSPDRQTKGE